MSPAAAPRFYAFLRAINVGGRRLTNEELIEPFVGLGLAEVAAYQAAGNITFNAEEPEATLACRIEAALAAAYGFEAPVFLRTAGELEALTEAEPFSPSEIASTAGRIQIAFMHSTPDAESVAEALRLVPVDDRVVFRAREWFWLPNDGISDSLLPVANIEKAVGPMTMRTHGTISRMLAKFGWGIVRAPSAVSALSRVRPTA